MVRNCSDIGISERIKKLNKECGSDAFVQKKFKKSVRRTKSADSLLDEKEPGSAQVNAKPYGNDLGIDKRKISKFC